MPNINPIPVAIIHGGMTIFTAVIQLGTFTVLLSRHYTTEHKVAFYAESLNITPDYLAYVLKVCTGSAPKETIEGKLVLAMKALQ